MGWNVIRDHLEPEVVLVLKWVQGSGVSGCREGLGPAVGEIQGKGMTVSNGSGGQDVIGVGKSL